MTKLEIIVAYNAALQLLRVFQSENLIPGVLGAELRQFLETHERYPLQDEPPCKHREQNGIADTHAHWCIECGALYDGAEWIYPHHAVNRSVEPPVEVLRDHYAEVVQDFDARIAAGIRNEWGSPICVRRDVVEAMRSQLNRT